MSHTIVLTGATSGLGRIAANSLVRSGADLILVGRDEAKLEATCQALHQLAPRARLNYFLADFTRLDSVAEAGLGIARRYPRVDTLVNNAGQHAFTQRITTDGFAEMVATNYLAPWLLTACLRVSLAAAGKARVVTVASEASRQAGELNPARDLHDTTPFTRRGSSLVYARTKLMNIMFSAELARRLGGTDVVSNCLDPGFNVTGLGRELPFAASLERLLRLLRIGNPERGASIIVRLASDPEFGSVTGQYFRRDGEAIQPVAPGRDAALQCRLWEATEQLLARFLPTRATATLS